MNAQQFDFVFENITVSTTCNNIFFCFVKTGNRADIGTARRCEQQNKLCQQLNEANEVFSGRAKNTARDMKWVHKITYNCYETGVLNF